MPSPIAPSATSSALAGIRAASLKLDASAAAVASASLPQGDTVSISAASRSASAGGADAGGIASAMVDLRVARYQNAASVAVLRTADDATRDLLRIGDPTRA
jgi:hypothetical protein